MKVKAQIKILTARKKRFQNVKSTSPKTKSRTNEKSNVLFNLEFIYYKKIVLEEFIVKGISQEVEKSYYRLTSAPVAANIRPEEILKKSLKMVKKKCKTGADYSYINDQLRSIRQVIYIYIYIYIIYI